MSDHTSRLYRWLHIDTNVGLSMHHNLAYQTQFLLILLLVAIKLIGHNPDLPHPHPAHSCMHMPYHLMFISVLASLIQLQGECLQTQQQPTGTARVIAGLHTCATMAGKFCYVTT